MKHHRLIRSTFAALAVLAASQARSQAQIPVFSIDWYGPTIGTNDSFGGFPITEGDLLAPQPLIPALGPLPTPGIVESAGFFPPIGLGLSGYLPCFGHPAYTACIVEVDALSHGLDALIQCIPGYIPVRQWAFSVGFRSQGVFGSPTPPAIWTEGPCQDEGADVYHDLSLPCGPLPPSPGGAHTGYIDGDGMATCIGTSLFPGTGLIEIAPPLIQGDNLDALDDDVPDRWLPETTCTYFSLDSAFVDPFTGFLNSGSAVAHGFVGGDVLVSCPGCGPAVYATAAQLGLDFFGPDTDDLDALALRENGVAGYQRSFLPFDWTSGSTDMLFFSVRRGSRLINTLDAFFGVPIVSGDILVPTGPLGSPPGIFIAAENLGLNTIRGLVPEPPSDDLDALDTLQELPQGNAFCFGDGTGNPCPCANFGNPGRGCANNVNPIGGLLWETGLASISNDRVHFTASGMTNTSTCWLIQGTAPNAGTPIGDGLRCIGGTLTRLILRSALCGNREFGYGVPGDPKISVVGGASAFQTLYYQVWYRDLSTTFCVPAATFNWTNGYSVTWAP